MEARSLPTAERRRRKDRRRSSVPGFSGPERRKSGSRRNTNRAAAAAGRAVTPDGALIHRLMPANGYRFLSPLRVLARIESEFAYVETDEAEGRRHVEAVIEGLRKDRRSRRHHTDDGRLEQLVKVKDKAVYLRFGDDPGSETEYLSTIVIPGEPLVVECDSPAHAQAAQPLLRRLAKALGYSIIKESADGQ